MTVQWRVIRDKVYPAPEGLALDETLLKSVEDRESENVLRLYFFSPPSVIIGHSQHINSVDLDFIKRNNMSFTRRMTGGGAIIMGCPDWHSQIGITLIVYDDGTYPPKLSKKFELFNRGVLLGLRYLNLDAEYCFDTTDTVVNDKKIAGSGIYSTSSAMLFHSTILIDYDLLTMLRAIKFPEEKINDSLLKKMENGYTTLMKELNLNQVDPTYIQNDVENNIIKGYKETLNIKFTGSSYTEKEILLSKKLVTEKYSCDEWIYTDGAHEMGACFLKKFSQ